MDAGKICTMSINYYKPGDWNAICDVCGFKFKASQLRKRWDGLMVCDIDWESRHPQELIRPIPDDPKLPWTRPEPTDRFTTIAALNDNVAGTNDGSGNGYCTVLNSQGVAGIGIVGC